MFFRQRWYDERLHHNLDEPLVVIVGVQHPTDIVWVPDTVFINSAVSSMHHVTVNHHKLDIYPNGTVFWGTRSVTCLEREYWEYICSIYYCVIYSKGNYMNEDNNL